MRHLKRKAEGFNIAFLDVMSCGLGAVILILMLVKYQTELPDQQSSALQADIAILEQQNLQSQQTVEALQTQTDNTQADLVKLNTQLVSLVTNINNQKDTQQSLKAQIAKLQSQANALAQTPPAPVPVVNKGLEDYLLGLEVKGKKIVILVDSSASMTEERLIDVIRYKVASAQERQQSPKWQRTSRIVEWLIAKVPEGSEYKMIRFAENASVVGGSAWKKGADPQDAATVLSDFEKIVPEGGTNLHSGIALMRSSAAGFTNIYLLTDGLPTKGDSGRVKAIASFFSGCTSITGNAQKISGKCRVRLLNDIVASYKERAVVNVILLPLEGDSSATSAFWRWTALSNGLLISPEHSWP